MKALCDISRDGKDEAELLNLDEEKLLFIFSRQVLPLFHLVFLWDVCRVSKRRVKIRLAFSTLIDIYHHKYILNTDSSFARKYAYLNLSR